MKINQREELSAVESARRLGVGLDYLYSLLWTRKLEGRKVGRTWRIPADAVEARLKQRGA
jgi:excisionase family DNA binding protein